MPLYRWLRGFGLVALLAAIVMAMSWMPVLTTPELLRIAGAALPALALLLVGRALKRAQKLLAKEAG
jgi:hypothetical protein